MRKKKRHKHSNRWRWRTFESFHVDQQLSQVNAPSEFASMLVQSTTFFYNPVESSRVDKKTKAKTKTKTGEKERESLSYIRKSPCTRVNKEAGTRRREEMFSRRREKKRSKTKKERREEKKKKKTPTLGGKNGLPLPPRRQASAERENAALHHHITPKETQTIDPLMTHTSRERENSSSLRCASCFFMLFFPILEKKKSCCCTTVHGWMGGCLESIRSYTAKLFLLFLLLLLLLLLLFFFLVLREYLKEGRRKEYPIILGGRSWSSESVSLREREKKKAEWLCRR